MRVLALDIGAGTEDVLLYDERKKRIENCIKMVLPSPSQVFAKKVRAATQMHHDLFVKGDIIGGGPFTEALREHIEKGYRVFMTKAAAYTVRNDLDQVKELGIKIVENATLKSFKGQTLVTEEVNIRKLQCALAFFDESFTDTDFVAIAVQDHGVPPKGESNRRFRIEKTRQLLERNPKPETFAFLGDDIPPHYLRMRSAAYASKRQLPNAEVVVMDTSQDAIVGCLRDPVVERANPILAVNVGNNHTMAAIISNGEITAIMEHHTRLLSPKKLEHLLIKFADGKLSDDEVFMDNGHGVIFLTEPPGFSKMERTVVAGPNRNILASANLPVHFATPAGDVMMTGPVGLVEVTKRILAKRRMLP